MIKRLFWIVVFCVSLASCAPARSTVDAETMYIKASALTKLSASVESTVRYKHPPEGISDAELLKLATEHDPSLLSPFKNYTIKVHQGDRHAVVLICSQDGTQGLLEDAGCSPPMDKHLWQNPGKTCAFTLSIQSVCSRVGN